MSEPKQNIDPGGHGIRQTDWQTIVDTTEGNRPDEPEVYRFGNRIFIEKEPYE